MKAITRKEKIMSGENLTPITRKELFLAKAAGQNVETPEPATREEMFLSKISGGSGGATINNQDKTITENGVYSADEGYTGLGTVTVEVASTGVGDIDALIDGSITDITSNVTKLAPYACYGRTRLGTVKFPLVSSLANYSFSRCNDLKIADFPLASEMWNNVFEKCRLLKALILRAVSVGTLNSTSALTSSGIGEGTGYIYVPRALVENYKAATNWSNFANQFRALEDYTVDGTVTGALDESKI